MGDRDARRVAGFSAWQWSLIALVLFSLLVVLAATGTVITFLGGTIMFMRDPLSIGFMTALFAVVFSAAFANVAAAVTRNREVRAGYTTLPNAYKQVEWRDHKTGIVLRRAGEAFPPGSMAELRRAAREADE